MTIIELIKISIWFVYIYFSSLKVWQLYYQSTTTTAKSSWMNEEQVIVPPPPLPTSSYLQLLTGLTAPLFPPLIHTKFVFIFIVAQGVHNNQLQTHKRFSLLRLYFRAFLLARLPAPSGNNVWYIIIIMPRGGRCFSYSYWCQQTINNTGFTFTPCFVYSIVPYRYYTCYCIMYNNIFYI